MHKKLLVMLVALLALSLLAGCPKKSTPTGMREARPTTGTVTTPSTENRQPKLVGELRDDHAKVKNILADLEKVSDQKDAINKLNDLRQALVPHMRAEERVVYPAMASAVGQDMIKTSINEHRAASQTVMQLQTMQASDPKFAQKVLDLTKAIDMHIAREEGQMFPEGEKTVSAQQWDQLKDQFDKTKKATLDALKQGGQAAETATAGPSGAMERSGTAERGSSQQSSTPKY